MKTSRIASFGALAVGIGVFAVGVSKWTGHSSQPPEPADARSGQQSKPSSTTIVNRMPCDNAPDRFGVYLDRSPDYDQLFLYKGNMKEMFDRGRNGMPEGQPVGTITQPDMTFDDAVELMNLFCISGQAPSSPSRKRERRTVAEVMLAMNIDP